jgi:hypothetical protein
MHGRYAVESAKRLALDVYGFLQLAFCAFQVAIRGCQRICILRAA